jgi:hypothetical protein
MISSRKLAAVAFVGGATLALLGGCAQSPPTYSGAMPMASPAAMREYLYAEALAAQRNAEAVAAAQQYERKFYAPPPQSRTQAPSYPAGAAIAGTTPAPAPQPAKPAAPRDADCVGWWRLCRLL